MTRTIGRGGVNDPTVATVREWLVTNGIGGYACGTIAGVLTRGYHGYLLAAGYNGKPALASWLLRST